MRSHAVPLRDAGRCSAKKRIEAELLIEFERQPAAAPLARTVEGEITQADLHDAGITHGRGAVVRKERDLLRRVLTFHKSVEGLAPRLTLAVVDLPKIKHLPLEDAFVVKASISRSPCLSPATLHHKRYPQGETHLLSHSKRSINKAKSTLPCTQLRAEASLVLGRQPSCMSDFIRLKASSTCQRQR